MLFSGGLVVGGWKALASDIMTKHTLTLTALLEVKLHNIAQHESCQL